MTMQYCSARAESNKNWVKGSGQLPQDIVLKIRPVYT